MSPSLDGGLLASRRSKLIALLLVATAAISVLVISAAGSAVSYYVTPEELSEHIASETDVEGTRWRIGGRVVAGTIVRENGRAIAWAIVGDEGGTTLIRYDGIVPDLFAPQAFVVVEGEVEQTAGDVPLIRASSVIIKHEAEFVTELEDSSVAPE